MSTRRSCTRSSPAGTAIVINHGTYEFESGLYGHRQRPGQHGDGAGYTANGIDHKARSRSTSTYAPGPAKSRARA